MPRFRCSPTPGVATRLPGSYPGMVPQPYGYNSSPLQPPTDYYVTRKEVKELLESLELSNDTPKVPGATPGSIAVFGDGGEIVDSKTSVESVRSNVSSNTAAISSILEILTMRDANTFNIGLEIKTELDRMTNDPESMTQSEKTAFLIKVLRYILANENLS